MGGRYDGTELNEGLSPITLGGAAVLKGRGLLAAAKDKLRFAPATSTPGSSPTPRSSSTRKRESSN